MADPLPCWPHGARAAVSLSYDDALPCHHAVVAPALEEHGLRGTFYAPFRDDLVVHTAAWREMAARGHELGNHSLFHPCRREPPITGDWLAAWNNLVQFDLARLRGELSAANFMLTLLDGRTDRTYGNTCHHTTIGPADAQQSMAPVLSELFVAARGALTNRPTDPRAADLHNLGTTGADGKRFADWRAVVDEAIATGGYVLLTFHGVGDGWQRLQVDREDHRLLLAYLQERQDQLWTAPVRDVALWIRDQVQV